ncbi:MAG: heme-binding domain-containing protein [Flavobacteriales bacterium]|nr:heme-binding domain-containing protein [Flavobacteriales bacterium]MCB9447245.1 heme-binding domain-containing protein [Flavobacteriales bacterium]
MQFIPVNRNQQDEGTSSDFLQTYHPPANISTLLKNACYNCHSNHTDYPWYSYVQPVGWYLERHINKGKENLNLSAFDTYSSRRKRSKLKSMIHQVKDGGMPLSSYTLMHKEARLSEDDKSTLISYLDSLRDSAH